MMRIPSVMLLFLLCAILAGSAACGIGGPGDQPDPDAAVYRDAAVDGAEDVPDADTVDAAPPELHVVPVSDIRELVKAAQGQTVVDLRPQDAYMHGFVPMAVSVPQADVWDGQGLVNGGQDLIDEAPVEDASLVLYNVAAEQPNVEALGQAMIDAGYSQVYVMDGGFEAWEDAGFFQDITMGGVIAFHYNPIPADHYIIDSMDAPSYDASGHITGAINVDTELFYLDGQLINNGQALTDLIPCSAQAIIYYCINEGCKASEEAAEATEQLRSCYTNTLIFHFPEGLELWENTSQPISCGPSPTGPPPPCQ